MNSLFERQEMLLGHAAMDELSQTHIAIIGIGGVGCGAAEALCRAGVGTLILQDHDIVAKSNCNRQLIATQDTIGKLKAEEMAKRCRLINPDINIIILPIFYTAETKNSLFDLHPHYIIDAIDTVTSKIDLIMTAHENNIPIISAMGTGNKTDPLQLEITDIFKTSVCPLAKVMRRELKIRGIKYHTVIYSKEAPLSPIMPVSDNDTTKRRSTPGSLSWVPPAAGMAMAGYAVKAILKSKGLWVK